MLEASGNTPTDIASLMVLIMANCISRVMEFVLFWIKIDDLHEFVRMVIKLDLPNVDKERIRSRAKRQLFFNLILITVVTALMANYNRSIFVTMFGDETLEVIWLQFVWWFTNFLSLGALFFSPSAAAKDMICMLTVSSLQGIFKAWNLRMDKKLNGSEGKLFTLSAIVLEGEKVKGTDQRSRRIEDIREELDTGLALAKIIKVRNKFIGPFLLDKFVVNLINCVSSLYISLSFFVKPNPSIDAILSYAANFTVFIINLTQIYFMCNEAQVQCDATQTSRDLIEQFGAQTCQNDRLNEPDEFKFKILLKKLNNPALLSPLKALNINNSAFPVAFCGVITYIIILYQLKLSGF